MSASSSTSLREEKLSRSTSTASTAFQSSRADGKDSASRTTSLFGGAGKKDGKPDVAQGQLGAIEEEVDGVFGEQGGAGTIDYRSVGWVWTSIILMKLQIGLGVLCVPLSLPPFLLPAPRPLELDGPLQDSCKHTETMCDRKS